MDDNIPRLNRILVTRTDRIGDLLLSTPVFSALRHHYPDCHIAVLVSGYASEVVEGHPAVDEVLRQPETEGRSFLARLNNLTATLRHHRFDALVVLHPTWLVALAGFLAGIRIRVGSGYRAYSVLFNKKIRQHRKDVKRHEVAYNLNMLEALGAKRTSEMPAIHLNEADHRDVADWLDRTGIQCQAPLIVLHPGSGGSARDWPIGHFAELADRLVSEQLGTVIITGGPQEEGVVSAVRGKMANTAHTMVGAMSIKQMGALLSRSSLCVANSTGPMHLSAAVGTPTIGLFCPVKVCSPVRWGPYGEGHKTLQPDVPACDTCIGEACEYHDCMNLISVESVLEAAKDILSVATQQYREQQ